MSVSWADAGGWTYLLPLGALQLFLHRCVVLGYRRQFSYINTDLDGNLLVGGVVVIGREAVQVQVVFVAHFLLREIGQTKARSDNKSQQSQTLTSPNGLGMVPKFANPHSLSQDMENTTRSEIAERAGLTSVVYDEASRSLKRDLDNVLRDTWVDVLAEISGPSGAKKHRKTAESCEGGDSQLGKDFFAPRNAGYHASASVPSRI